MNCPDTQILAAYIDQSLTVEEKCAVEEHVKTCKVCPVILATGLSNFGVQVAEPVRFVFNRAAPLEALDRIVRIDDSSIVTSRTIDEQEPFFVGHYPDQPIFPGVFIIEAVHQAVLCYATTKGKQAHLKQVRSARFQMPVEPGCTLESSCTCIRSDDGSELTVKAICTTAKGRVAELKLHFALEDGHD